MAQLQIWQIWRAESKTLITLDETEQLLNNSVENKTCFASGTVIGTIAREIFTVYTVFSDAILQEGTAANLQVKCVLLLTKWGARCNGRMRVNGEVGICGA